MLAGGLRSRIAWAAAVFPLALPAPLAGLGLAVLWDPPGTLAMPVLAALTRGAPLASILLAAQRRRTEPRLLEAAHVFGRSRWHAWRAVHLPLVGRGVLAAAGLVFALSLGELGATLMVVPPGAQTLTLRVYTFLHAGASEEVAALCLLLGLLAVVGASAAGWWTRAPAGFRSARA
jgi:iron(III) transport system permease protein